MQAAQYLLTAFKFNNIKSDWHSLILTAKLALHSIDWLLIDWQIQIQIQI